MACNGCPKVESCQKYIADRGSVEMAFTQTLSVAELDIVNFCNLSCYACNRFMDSMPTKGMMSVEQVTRLVDESIELDWEWKELRVMGGEPTIHPQFVEVLNQILRLKEHNSDLVLKVITNGSGKKVKERIKLIPEGYLVMNSETRYEETGKPLTDRKYAVRPNARIIPGFGNMFQAPIDKIPLKRTQPMPGTIPPSRNVNLNDENTVFSCQVHETCGLGISHNGILPCGCGNGIARVVGLDFYFKSLSEVTVEACHERLKILCGLCGRNLHYVESVEDNIEMSDFWRNTFQEYHTKGEPKLPKALGG